MRNQSKIWNKHTPSMEQCISRGNPCLAVYPTLCAGAFTLWRRFEQANMSSLKAKGKWQPVMCHLCTYLKKCKGRFVNPVRGIEKLEGGGNDLGYKEEK